MKRKNLPKLAVVDLLPPNACVNARRWWAVERDEGGHRKSDIKTAQVTGRASGVACNALLGGPGAGLKLQYIARVARCAFLTLTAARARQKQWNAVRERSKAAHTRLGAPLTLGRPQRAATREQ